MPDSVPEQTGDDQLSVVPNRRDRRMSRATFVQGALLAGAGVVLSPSLGCAGSTGTSSTASSATPVRRGGTLRVGHVGGGNAETFDPAIASTYIDASRCYNLYDRLTLVQPNLTRAPGLALEWLPNRDFNSWELKLRPDVTWHNGKSFTAADVIYTLRLMGNPAHYAHASVAGVDLHGLRAKGPLTLEIPLTKPNRTLQDGFLLWNSVIVQDGEKNYAHPIGTGPFMFKSFTPGQESTCVRNPNYWVHGKPYVDEWQDVSINDDGARVEALLSGHVDMMSQLPLGQAKPLAGQINVIDAPSPQVQVFIMAVDMDPFVDVRVRRAFKLIADREQLVSNALFGFGRPGNDIFGEGLPHYLDLPVPQPDIEQAKHLLKAAGKEGLTVTFHTSPVVPGFVESATLFAQQANAAGVNVVIKNELASDYFNASGMYTHLNFAQSIWPIASLSSFYQAALLSDAPFNETHWRNPAFDATFNHAIGAPSAAESNQAWKALQETQYHDGGYLVWANANFVDAASNRVGGITPSAFANLGGWDYKSVWLG